MFDNINLKDYEIISFDIFDTLIVRYVEKPIDIFAIIEDKAENAKNFQVNRINAEIHARKKYAREIKLDDIYAELTDIYDDNLIKRLKSMEIALESDFCIKREDVYNFFQTCQNNHKRIIITSDMYLPKEVIEDILNKNDILNYEHLYLSSEVGEQKKDGKLFQHIIKDLNVEPSKILHIGDNRNSDYNKPNKLGIKSLLIEKVKVNDNKNFLLKDSIYSKIINRFIYLNLENRGEKNYEYILGYKTFGIILYGFALWLKEALNKENIKKVYFLSRDGWILKKAFNLINGNDKFDTRYLFASRRSLIVPCIWMCKDYDDTKILLNIPSRITKEKFLKNVGLDSHISVISATELKEVLDEEKQKELYECLKHIIITNSKKEYYSIKKYLEQQQFYGRLAIVDIGWAGRMQNALYNLTLDKDIFGFYVGTRKFKEIDKLDYIKRTGYLFNRNINNNSIYLGAMNALFETFFLGNHGSVKNFEIDATGKIKVNLYEYEYKNAPEQKDVIKKFQLGALNFVEDLNKSVLKKWITIENNLVCNNMVKTFLNPTIRTCKLFGDIVFLDHFHTYIARPNDWSFYIKHPNKIYSDLKQSTWKIAFISRLTNIYSSLWFYLYYCLKKYCKKE